MEAVMELKEVDVKNVDNVMFKRIGEDLPILSQSGAFESDNVPARALALSNRFGYICFAHSRGFSVAKTADLLDVAEKLSANADGSKAAEEATIANVTLPEIRSLALSSDELTVCACAGEDVMFYELGTLVHKSDTRPFELRKVDSHDEAKDFCWSPSNSETYLILTSQGKLLLGQIGSEPECKVEHGVVAASWSADGQHIAYVADSRQLNITTSNFAKTFQHELPDHLSDSADSLDSADSDDDSELHVDAIRWVRPDSIVIGYLRVNSEGEEDECPLFVLSSRNGDLAQEDSSLLGLVFYQVFPSVDPFAVPSSIGPYMLLDYVKPWELVVSASRKSIDDHIVLMGWFPEDERDVLYSVEVGKDAWIPRIELQDSGEDNAILGLAIDRTTVQIKLPDPMDESGDTMLPPCPVLVCLTLEGKLSFFSFARLGEKSQVPDLVKSPSIVPDAKRSISVPSSQLTSEQSTSSALVPFSPTVVNVELPKDVLPTSVPTARATLLNQGEDDNEDPSVRTTKTLVKNERDSLLQRLTSASPPVAQGSVGDQPSESSKLGPTLSSQDPKKSLSMPTSSSVMTLKDLTGSASTASASEGLLPPFDNASKESGPPLNQRGSQPPSATSSLNYDSSASIQTTHSGPVRTASTDTSKTGSVSVKNGPQDVQSGSKLQPVSSLPGSSKMLLQNVHTGPVTTSSANALTSGAVTIKTAPPQVRWGAQLPSISSSVPLQGVQTGPVPSASGISKTGPATIKASPPQVQWGAQFPAANSSLLANSGVPVQSDQIGPATPASSRLGTQGRGVRVGTAANTNVSGALAKSPLGVSAAPKVLSNQRSAPISRLLQEKQPGGRAPPVTDMEAAFNAELDDVRKMSQKVDDLMLYIEGRWRGDPTEEPVVFTKQSLEELEDRMHSLSKECKACKERLKKNRGAIEDLRDEEMRVDAWRIYIQSLMDQKNDSRYQELWNTQKLQPGLEMKRQHILKADQELKQHIAELEGHLHVLELKQFQQATARRRTNKQAQSPGQFESTQHLYNTVNIQMAVAEELSNTLTRQMEALNIKWSPETPQSTASKILKSVGADTDDFQNGHSPLPRIRLSYSSMPDRESMNGLSALSVQDKEPSLQGTTQGTRESRRDYFDPAWVREVPITIIKRVVPTRPSQIVSPQYLTRPKFRQPFASDVQSTANRQISENALSASWTRMGPSPATRSVPESSFEGSFLSYRERGVLTSDPQPSSSQPQVQQTIPGPIVASEDHREYSSASQQWSASQTITTKPKESLFKWANVTPPSTITTTSTISPLPIANQSSQNKFDSAAFASSKVLPAAKPSSRTSDSSGISNFAPVVSNSAPVVNNFAPAVNNFPMAPFSKSTTAGDADRTSGTFLDTSTVTAFSMSTPSSINQPSQIAPSPVRAPDSKAKVSGTLDAFSSTVRGTTDIPSADRGFNVNLGRLEMPVKTEPTTTPLPTAPIATIEQPLSLGAKLDVKRRTDTKGLSPTSSGDNAVSMAATTTATSIFSTPSVDMGVLSGNASSYHTSQAFIASTGSAFSTSAAVPNPSTGSVFSTSAAVPNPSTGSAFSTSAAVPNPSTGSAFSTSAAVPNPSTGSAFTTSAALPNPSTGSAFSNSAAVPNPSTGSAFSTSASVLNQSSGSLFGSSSAPAFSASSPQSTSSSPFGQSTFGQSSPFGQSAQQPVQQSFIFPGASGSSMISNPALPSPNVESNEEDMEEETSTGVGTFGGFGGLGLGSSQAQVQTPKANPFGGSNFGNSQPFSLAPATGGQLFRPATFSLPAAQSSPQQAGGSTFGSGFGSSGFSQTNLFSESAKGFGSPPQSSGGAFGQPAQVGVGQQALGSALGAFGQTRQVGFGTPYGNAGVGSGSSLGFGNSSPGGAFAAAPIGGGFAGAATGGGFAGAASGSGFAGAASGTGFAGAGGAGFGGLTGGTGFQAFAGNQGASPAFGSGGPPAQTSLFTQMRK